MQLSGVWKAQPAQGGDCSKPSPERIASQPSVVSVINFWTLVSRFIARLLGRSVKVDGS